ncbi:MAG: 3-deoxy-manno-octulosonate-8-phosphatase KdsC [Gammaproteobacteria bacterium]
MRSVYKKLSSVKLLICDVDGVFTNSHLYMGNDLDEIKAFHIHDGLGIKRLLANQIEVAVITARVSQAVAKRMSTLGIKHLHQGQQNKLPAYEHLLMQLQLQDEEIAYIGDDLPDLPLIQRAGFGVAVANAVAEVKQSADWVTQLPGGQGAIRELAELILSAKEVLQRA